MKRIYYYAITAVLLAGGASCLYLGQDMYAGMFFGVFFTFIKDILGIEKENNLEEEFFGK